MNLPQHTVISLVVVVVLCFMINTSSSCSSSPYEVPRSLAELTILAPVVIVGRALNISVPADMAPLTSYSACFEVKEVIKGRKLRTADVFCAGDFGTDAACLSQVYPGYSYVVYLNSDLTARYETHFSAAHLANGAVIQSARQGYCDPNKVNDSSCVSPVISDEPKRVFIVKEGSSLDLICNVFGTRPYVVSWRFNGRENYEPLQRFERSDGRLSLTSASESYQGRYTCDVRNAAGKTSQDMNVFVDVVSCGGNIMVNERTRITSPNFPGLYPHDKSCVWRFCPAPGKRIKFSFSKFHIESSDSLLIDHECTKSVTTWRRYCGSKSPGTFVSPCKSGCVQVRLESASKYNTDEFFIGMEFTAESTSDEETPQHDILKHYCASDIVLKGRPNEMLLRLRRKLRIKAVESFKNPYKANATYDMHYRPYKDDYGCYVHGDNKLFQEQFYFGVGKNGRFQLIARFPAGAWDDATGVRVEDELRTYKEMTSPCSG